MSPTARQLDKNARIALPVAAVWTAWTTAAGLKAFLGTEASIELRSGGKYEIYFDPSQPTPDQGSESCTVLSFLPERMLSFTWNVPPKFPELRALGPTTFVVVEFSPSDDNATEVRLTHLGWPEGPEWDGPLAYFDKAWDFVLNALQKYRPLV